MAPPELELLKTSILADGWTQPIVVLPDMTIEADPLHRMASTVRHNRARGMEDEEFERLLDRAGMPVRGTAGVSGFGRPWVPDRGST